MPSRKLVFIVPFSIRVDYFLRENVRSEFLYLDVRLLVTVFLAVRGLLEMVMAQILQGFILYNLFDYMLRAQSGTSDICLTIVSLTAMNLLCPTWEFCYFFHCALLLMTGVQEFLITSTRESRELLFLKLVSDFLVSSFILRILRLTIGRWFSTCGIIPGRWNQVSSVNIRSSKNGISNRVCFLGGRAPSSSSYYWDGTLWWDFFELYAFIYIDFRIAIITTGYQTEQNQFIPSLDSSSSPAPTQARPTHAIIILEQQWHAFPMDKIGGDWDQIIFPFY